MEIDSKERKMVYYPLESDEIIERDLDKFIAFMVGTGRFDGKRCWHYQNEICSFFGIHNTTYIPSEDKSGSDYPHVDSHCAEKANLINELIELELIEPKSSTTYYLSDGLYDEDIIDTQMALDTIYCILKNTAKSYSPKLHELKETCVWSQKDGCKPFIAWHQNKFFPNATVDKLKELGWKEFYELNKTNIQKKREYFASIK